MDIPRRLSISDLGAETAIQMILDCAPEHSILICKSCSTAQILLHIIRTVEHLLQSLSSFPLFQLFPPHPLRIQALGLCRHHLSFTNRPLNPQA